MNTQILLKALPLFSPKLTRFKNVLGRQPQMLLQNLKQFENALLKQAQLRQFGK